MVFSSPEWGKRERLHTESKATFDRMPTQERRVSLGHAKEGGHAELQVMLRKGRRSKPTLGEKVVEVSQRALRTTWRFAPRRTAEHQRWLWARGSAPRLPGPRPCAFVRWPLVTLELCGAGQGLHSTLQQGRAGPASRVEKARLVPDLSLWIQAP